MSFVFTKVHQATGTVLENKNCVSMSLAAQPLVTMPYNRQGWITDMHMRCKVARGTKCLNLAILPIVLLIFDAKWTI